MTNNPKQSPDSVISFFDQPQVDTDVIPIGKGVPLGIKRVFHPELNIGGVYGTWGESYDNEGLFHFLEKHLGEPLPEGDRMNLAPLGFLRRHHVADLGDEEHLELEVEIGARLLREAAKVNGWETDEVEGVLIGMTGPIADDYTERIAHKAGIPESALKISVHKACDSSIGALHLILNPELAVNHQIKRNIAEEMYGKKVLVGGIEGLSRFVMKSRDISALQLFGNGAGVIGVIPGQTMKFLVGKTHEVFDTQGVLALSMKYPHSGQLQSDESLIEVSQAGTNHLRFAGLETGSAKEISVTIVHHANLKINRLKAKRLKAGGVDLNMPWMLSEFGNVSAASNMIAFLRHLPKIKPGDHVLFDGFGAGTYYDTFAVSF